MTILDVAALQGMSQAELEALTKGEIIAAIVGDQVKTECTKSVDGPNGQVSREYVTKDALGVLIETEKWDWVYGKDGVVKEITKTVLDEKALPIEVVKIATVDGALKAVPLPIKEMLPIDEKVPVEEAIIK